MKNRSKPMIGIPARYHKKSNTLGVKRAYIDEVLLAGGYPVLLTYDECATELIVDEMLDGLLLIGGEDISPESGGASKYTPGYQYCVERDTFELELVKYGIKKGLPILGICRGMQVLFSATGGKIIYDVEEENQSGLKHRLSILEPSFHDVNIFSDSKLFDICGQNKIHVTSYHHQGIRWSPEQDALWKISAKSEDGIIEAIELKDAKYILGVLWHPEIKNNQTTSQDNIIRDFVLKLIR